MNHFTKLFIASLAIIGAGSLSACNTVEGAGKDIERGGEKLQNANCTKEETAKDPNCKK